jgi:hypothetical protein
VAKSFHVCIDVRGAIRNAHDENSTARCFTHDDGRPATLDEGLDFLMDQLAAGRNVIPMGEACEGFDYSGGGCPGHEC